MSFAGRNGKLHNYILLLSECVLSVTKHFLNMYNRSIMSDIQRDNRVVSLSSRAGIRNSLVTILDQLQRCQKSLNEFLEVHTYIFVSKDICACITSHARITTSFLSICVWLLQEKRSAFPRFYFIGDDDLLEILGQATNPTVIQSHLKKLFAGQKPMFCSILYSVLLNSDLFCFSYLLFTLFFASILSPSHLFLGSLVAYCLGQGK